MATIDEQALGPLMRSGAAARLAGLSASTLRIWEHRYGVVAPPKSISGQRMYSMHDIERPTVDVDDADDLRMLRDLIEEAPDAIGQHTRAAFARLDQHTAVAVAGKDR